MSEYEEEYKRRSDDDSYLGDVPIVAVENHHIDGVDVEVVCRDEHILYGLRDSGGEMLLPCVFDKIEFVGTSSLVSLAIDDQQRIYDTYKGRYVTIPGNYGTKEYPAYESVEIICDGKHGLWSCMNHKLIVPIEYLDVTCSCRHRFLWVERVEGIYGYVDTLNDKLLGIDSSCGFDHSGVTDDYVYTYKEKEGVVAIGLDGYADIKSMRREVCSRKGRLYLRNDKTDSTVVVDIYGNIIKHL